MAKFKCIQEDDKYKIGDIVEFDIALKAIMSESLQISFKEEETSNIAVFERLVN